MKRLARYILPTAAAAFLFTGCDSPTPSFAVDVDAAEWNDSAVLSVPNADTVTLRNIDLFLRCNDRFREDTLSVRITLTTPDSLRCEEIFRLTIPAKNSPAPLQRIATIPYRRHAVFSQDGDYKLTINPLRPVQGVEAVGVQFTKSN